MPPRDSIQKWPSIAAIALALLPMVCGAQSLGLARNILTNRDIVTLANAGFSEAFIIQTIATSSTKFELTADALADLAKNGITEDIVSAMRNPSGKPKNNGAANPGWRPAFQPAGAAAVREETAAPKEPDASARPNGPIRIFVETSANPSSPSQSRTQSISIMKAFGQICHTLVVTNRREEATFVVAWDRESGNWLTNDNNNMVVFNRSGDMVYGTSARLLDDAVRRFCKASQKMGFGIPADAH
jgi:hypothetical protein